MKTHLRYVMAALAACFLLTDAPAQAMTLKVVSINGPAGADVEIVLEASDANKLGPIQMLFLFDGSVLKITKVEPGDAYDGSVEFSSHAAGELSILMLSDADEGVEQDGPIAIITANVIGQTGDKCLLGLRHVRAWKRDTSSPSEFDVITEDGELTVVSAQIPWVLIAAIVAGVLILIVLFRRGRKSSPKRVPVMANESTTACRACGHANRKGVKSCESCGTSMNVKNVACSRCGNEIEPNAKFCGECGTPVATT